MLKHSYSVLCKDILYDKINGSSTYYKLIDHVVTTKIPGLIPYIYIGSCWESPIGHTYDFRFTFKDAEGKSAVANINDFEVKKSITRINVRLNDIKIFSEGNCTFDVEARHKDSIWLKYHSFELPIIQKSN